MISLLWILAGSYVQDCQNGYQRAEHFAHDQVVYEEKNFHEMDCERPLVTARSYGSYMLGAGDAGSVQKIDFIFDRVTLAPETAELAAHYRERALCGLSDWEEGQEREVTGLYCDLFHSGQPYRVPFRGEWRYGIVKVDRNGNDLYFGDLTPVYNGLAPEKRPLELDSLPYRRTGI